VALSEGGLSRKNNLIVFYYFSASKFWLNIRYGLWRDSSYNSGTTVYSNMACYFRFENNRGL